MTARPASFTQADVARAIRAAKQAGAAEVEVQARDGATILIRLASSTAPAGTPLETGEDIVL